jgi:hypothetical protein
MTTGPVGEKIKEKKGFSSPNPLSYFKDPNLT